VVPFTADTTIGTLMARVDAPLAVPPALGALREPLERAGWPEPSDRPDAAELGVALLAAAEGLPRPEPLPLAGAITYEPGDSGEDGDQTVLAPSTMATTSTSVLDGTAVPGLARDEPVLVEIEDEPPPRHRRRRWLVVALVALLAVVAGVGVGYAWVNSRTPTYEVPSLVELTEEQARAEVGEFGWRVEVEDIRQDGTTPGEVVRTEPEAGADLEEGGTLRLFVSLGNELRVVPQGLVGRPEAEAVAALEAAGLRATAKDAFSEDVADGIVLALPNDLPRELPGGTQVELTVSRGPEPRTLPGDLAGLAYEEAAARLGELGLVPVREDHFSDDVERGRVIGTDPAAGASVPRDSDVKVLVSKGPDVVRVPDIGGMTIEQALATLERAGLVAGDLFGPARGRPFATEPGAGTEVRRGTTVNIYLRR
jgi:serine/threonine-protein kinase